jgi:nitrogen fixation NifU-like protein
MSAELYQQMILEHYKNPRNFRKIENPSHCAEGHNPLCGDHLTLFLNVDPDEKVLDLAFQGSGCAISKASASLMTSMIQGKTRAEAKQLFEEFHALVTGKLKLDTDPHHLGKLTVFSGIWGYPSRVKCAILCWHTLMNAMDKKGVATTE